MRTRTALSLGAATVFLLSGCGTVGIVPSQELRFDVRLTPAEARADLTRRSNDVQSVLGGDWQNEDNFIATGCSEGRGFYYYGGRIRTEPVVDREESAERISQWWEDNGYSVSRADYGETVVLGSDADNGMEITLHFDEARTWFQTDGPCLVGDWKAISDDDFVNHRNNFSRTPSPSP
ncbi:hypothetical protein [Leifsonia aquatica]|jgi:hypothetical protein|uniref:hypothetical protein n=1 Tax=Leifsonia aquatica TaxID=144185 RepID=UPI0037F29A19